MDFTEKEKVLLLNALRCLYQFQRICYSKDGADVLGIGQLILKIDSYGD